jgi:hypothetical protein
MPFLAISWIAVRRRPEVDCQRDGDFRTTLCALFLFSFHGLARLVSARTETAIALIRVGTLVGTSDFP